MISLFDILFSRAKQTNTHTEEYNSAFFFFFFFKKKGNLAFVTTRVALEDIMLSEISQT